MFHLVSDDSAHAAPPGSEPFSLCIILPIMQRICGDENSPSIVLSGEEGKQENTKTMKEHAAKPPPPNYTPLPAKLSDDTGEP